MKRKHKKPFNYTKAFRKSSKHNDVAIEGYNWSQLKAALVIEAKEKAMYRVGRQVVRAST